MNYEVMFVKDSGSDQKFKSCSCEVCSSKFPFCLVSIDSGSMAIMGFKNSENHHNFPAKCQMGNKRKMFPLIHVNISFLLLSWDLSTHNENFYSGINYFYSVNV